MSEYAVSMEHITKTFPGVKALDDVQLHLRTGEVMALLERRGEVHADEDSFRRVYP